MKQWVRRHPYLALAFGYVVFFVFTSAAWLVIGARDLVDALLSGFIYSSIYGLFSLFQLRNVRKTKQRLDQNGQFRAFIRYPDSRPGSLSGIWNRALQPPTPGLSSSSLLFTTAWSLQDERLSLRCRKSFRTAGRSAARSADSCRRTHAKS